MDDRRNKIKTQVDAYKLSREQFKLLMGEITKVVVEIQDKLHKEEQATAFTNTSALGLPEKKSDVQAREEALRTLEYDAEAALRDKVFEMLGKLLGECHLGTLKTKKDGAQFWKIKDLDSFKQDNQKLKDRLFELLKKGNEKLQKLEGKEILSDAEKELKQKLEKEIDKNIEQIFGKANTALEQFNKLENTIKATAFELIKHRKSQEDTQRAVTLTLVYGLVAAVVGVVATIASVSVIAAVIPTTTSFLIGFAAVLGVTAGVTSAIGGVISVAVSGWLSAFETPFFETQEAKYAAETAPTLYKTEITDLMKYLDDFRKSLPTELAKITQTKDVVKAVEYKDNIDKGSEKKIKSMQAKYGDKAEPTKKSEHRNSYQRQ